MAVCSEKTSHYFCTYVSSITCLFFSVNIVLQELGSRDDGTDVKPL